MILTWVLISNVLLFRKGGLFLNREIYQIFWLAYIWIAETDSNAVRFSRPQHFGVIDFACIICVSFSNFILEFSDFHVSGYLQLCSKVFSTSAVAVQGINENYWLCVTTALFTNKAQMNRVLVQRSLVSMWALLHFWNVSLLPLQVLSRMSSEFYCRSGWSGAMPIFFKFIQLHWDVERLREPGWGGGHGCDMDNTLPD